MGTVKILLFYSKKKDGYSVQGSNLGSLACRASVINNYTIRTCCLRKSHIHTIKRGLLLLLGITIHQLSCHLPGL